MNANGIICKLVVFWHAALVGEYMIDLSKNSCRSGIAL